MTEDPAVGDRIPDDPAPGETARRAPAPPDLAPDPSPLRFAGAVALVVGGGNGIGAACATRLAAEGASVIVADLEEESARSVAESLPVLAEARHHAMALDVTDGPGVREGVGRAVARYGRLDVLAHVAGGTVPNDGPVDTGDDVWTHLLDLNLVGAVRTARAAIPHLRRSGRAAIVTITSVNGIMPLGDDPYDASKAGLISLTRDLAAHLGPDGVRVNAIAPGTIRTRVWDREAEGADARRDWYPLGRVGEPADVAAALAFLASGDAAWVTGQVLAVDGGLLLRGTGAEGE